MSTDLSPGVVVAGRYRLDRLLGRGGMGQVWAVTHEVTHRVAALKLLDGPIHHRESRRRRFLREARASSAVKHPNVVLVHDFFELADGSPVMIMDLLEGETLGRKLVREGPLPLDVAASILVPVVSAVGTAHSIGIIHRDLKPENVFLSALPGGGFDVHVLDFGIAKLVHAGAPIVEDFDALTGTGGMVGTPIYMSPEQGFGEGNVDHRSDIWSLGVVLYEMLSGARPVDGANVGQVLKRLLSEVITPVEVLVPELPPDIADLVGRMLQRHPEARPSDLREVLAVLSRHTRVSAPTFGVAISESPPLDSSPTSGRSSPCAVVRALSAPDVDAATELVEPTLVATAPSRELRPSGTAAIWGRRVLYGLGALGTVVAFTLLWSLRSPRAAPPERTVPPVAAAATSASASIPDPPATTAPDPVATAPHPPESDAPVPPLASSAFRATGTGHSDEAKRTRRRVAKRAHSPTPAASSKIRGLWEQNPF